MEKLVLIDGNSILNRAFYGIMGSKMLSTPDGTPTNAVYGFLAIMFKILEDVKPEYLAVAFDLKAPTKRHIMYDQYKATRKGMPDELAVQLPIIKEILQAMRIQIIEKQGYEADDILGTLAKSGEQQEKQVIILTGDRDAFQLASDKITIRIPRTKAGKTETEDFNKDKIKETYGLEPLQLIEVKGLMGDTSDNIPGVKGIGEKTALSLIQEYQSIENLYNKIHEENTIKPKTKEKLIEGEELARLSRTLGTIDINAEIDKDVEKLKVQEWDEPKVIEIFKNLRFNRYLERFNLKEEEHKNIDETINIEECTDIEKIKTTIKEQKTMYFFVETEEVNKPELIIEKQIKSISVYDKQTNTSYYIRKKHLNEFKEIWEDKDILKCSIQLKETYILLLQENIEPQNLMFDVEIAGYILNSISNAHTIQDLAYLYLQADISHEETKKTEKQEQMTFFGEQTVEEEINKKAAINAYCIYELYSILKQKLSETEQLELFETIEMPLVEVLARMQYTGMLVDKDALIKFGEELDEKINVLVEEIYKLAKTEFNINSTKQLGEILFDKLKLPVQKKTKSGYSTDGEVLEKLKDQHPIIDKILDYRQLTKLKTTFVSAMLPYIKKGTGRIHSTFHQTITATGRISSSDPNLQNIPTRIEIGKKLRKVFVAPKGTVLLDADYSQIELRVLADIAEDKTMIQAFVNDEDIHTQVAAKVFGKKMSEVTAEERTHAKAVNFGIVYGISDFGLGEQLKIEKKQAKEYIEQYLTKYKGIKNFMTEIIEIAKEKGYVETKFKRRRYVPELNSKNYLMRQFGTRVALNTPIQGTAADIMKIAMIDIYNSLKTKKLKSRLVLQVHDEIIVETLEEEKEVVKEIVQSCMENATKLCVPLKVDMSDGKDWYSAK